MLIAMCKGKFHGDWSFGERAEISPPHAAILITITAPLPDMIVNRVIKVIGRWVPSYTLSFFLFFVS